jgi:hypothetical protein
MILARTRHFIGDIFTGPDGKTYGLGRIYSIPVLITGIGAPIYQLLKGTPVPLTELGVELGAVAGAVMILVTGTNHIDTPGANILGNQAGATQ